MKKVVSVSLLLASLVLIQAHSIGYWVDVTGNKSIFGVFQIGVLWSLTLEVSALWLWNQRKNLLGVLASCLLLAGPMVDLVGVPYTKHIDVAEFSVKNRQLLEIKENQIRSLENSLAVVEKNSQGNRAGWGAHIDKTKTQIKEATVELSELVVQSKAEGNSFLLVMKGLYLFLALLLTHLVQIGAVRSFRKKDISWDSHGVLNEKLPENKEKVLSLSKKEILSLLKKGRTPKDLSSHYGVPISTLYRWKKENK